MHGNFARRLLFNILPFELYLKILSQFYFVAFDLGVLRRNRLFAYPYFLNKIVCKGDFCLDIGANLGYITVLLSKLAGGEGKVFAVEPVAPIFSVLKSNTKSLRNVEVFPFALGSENRKIKLGNITKKDKGFVASGSNFILEDESQIESAGDVEFNAEMKKGSELFAHLVKLDFIKCDIEGYEVIVLLELEPLIVKFQPILLVESQGDNRIKMLNFFKNHNYYAFTLERGVLQPAKEDEFWDILFVPQSKLEKVSKHISNYSEKRASDLNMSVC